MHTIVPGSAHAAPNGGSSDFSTHLYAFLDRLSPSMVGRLYDAPASCLSIFRLLPATGRHIVLNLLWYEQSVTMVDLALWVRTRKSDGGSSGEHRHLSQALTALARLHILNERPGSADELGEGKELDLNQRFRENFRLALTGGGTHGSFGVPSLNEDPSIDVAFLDSYAETQWEMIQHFMVGSSIAGIQRPSDGVLNLLMRSELMTSPTKSLRTLSITSKGFQFLLEDVNTQLWDLLLQYLEEASDVVRVLGFLFMLGSLVLGRGYSTERFSETELTVLHDLRDYGLVYQPSPTSTDFYPTRLATTLTSSAPPLVSSRHADEERGFLVLETNFKVYAYTANPLQIAVLNLFVHLKARFPNFVTGQITRESVRRGLTNGITANQIISYLTTRAHPQMRADQIREGAPSVLPTTVVDQIRLWQQEGERVQSTEGYLYDDFSAAADYELVATYARELGVMLWESPPLRKMFVTGEGHTQVREYIRRRMAGGQ
ncbi:RNA polymerase II transcription factor B subunit 2 [Leucosporidium creatinivorum]|uniref:RNA polymerase II transcription factor B subunit 2 n=1 Tax=Leucosporidium creatinivorum TaxID=106004 RepID=A0A1Y2FXX9_9BASI|nr:RNA polymerase II transcription factor B subunit 2 [Leucosporidium creatinivorum]